MNTGEYKIWYYFSAISKRIYFKIRPGTSSIFTSSTFLRRPLKSPHIKKKLRTFNVFDILPLSRLYEGIFDRTLRISPKLYERMIKEIRMIQGKRNLWCFSHSEFDLECERMGWNDENLPPNIAFISIVGSKECQEYYIGEE
jgi:hypothetical protein